MVKACLISALRHLLEVAEGYERTKEREAAVPQALLDRNVIQTEQLRLNVAAGSWVLLVRRSGGHMVDEICEILEHAPDRPIMLHALGEIASGKLTKKVMMELAQDTLATVEPPGKIQFAKK